MNRFIVLLFATILINPMVPDFLMGQESLEKEGAPFYSLGGRRIQSLALYDNSLIADPIAEEWYKIPDNAATLGYVTKDNGFDISLTAYGGALFMKKPNGSFESMDGAKDSPINKNVSLIGNIAIIHSYGFSFSAYYDSESEYFERNGTAGMTIQYETGRIILNAEYIDAIHREEDYYFNNTGYKEYVWFGALAYKLRKPLQLVIRYKTFHDDIPGEQEKILDERISVGGKVTLFAKGPFNTNLMAEYRKSSFKKITTDSASNNKDEFLTRLAIEF